MHNAGCSGTKTVARAAHHTQNQKQYRTKQARLNGPTVVVHSTIHYKSETTQLQTHRSSIFFTESDEANYEQTPRSEDSSVAAPLHCPEPIPLGIGRGKQQGKSHTAIALCPFALGAPTGNPNSPFIVSYASTVILPSVRKHSVLGHCLESCLEGFIPTDANQHAETGNG